MHILEKYKNGTYLAKFESFREDGKAKTASVNPHCRVFTQFMLKFN